MFPPEGILSAIVVAIYVPVLIFAIRITISSKDPLRRWRTLLVCILYRLSGSTLLIPLVGLQLPMTQAQTLGWLGFTLDVCSSWALTICTAYLINIADEGGVTQRGSSSVSGDHSKKNVEALVLPGNVTVIAIIPSVWAISLVVLQNFPGQGSDTALHYITPLGPVVVALLFITVVWYAVRTWFRFERMLHYRKRLLVLITVTLPLIAARVVYGIFTGFVHDNGMIWMPGSFPMYFVTDVLMECIVVIIYTVAGTLLPLDEDYRLTDEYPFLRLQYLGDMENQL